MGNIDTKTVDGFGEEWASFDQSELSDEILGGWFEYYFDIFPWEALPENPVGFDMGCGSGRWAKFAAARVGKLYCVDASEKALETAKRTLSESANVEFVHASVDELPFADNSIDFAYSLGVLHHIPDTAAGIQSCVKKLKPGAPFLVYLYYAFDNRSFWFRALWKISDLFRRFICVLPFGIKKLATDLIAATVYFPLARTAAFFEKLGFGVDAFPLSFYRHQKFYTMRTDALDRFGTRLEQRFTKGQITAMMENAGLEGITFSDTVPYWCAVGVKRSAAL
jgi:ubiquinone/menaquinone biosynthesis C-methylase UbiE